MAPPQLVGFRIVEMYCSGGRLHTRNDRSALAGKGSGARENEGNGDELKEELVVG
jgi:hypothetical protein